MPMAFESFFHFFEFVRLDNGFDFFHDVYASKLYPSSPCMLRSRPSHFLILGETRTPMMASQIFRMTNVPTIGQHPGDQALRPLD